MRLDGFGMLGTRDFSFSPEVNLIFGPNEAGKTTLFDAIERALFGRSRSRRRYEGKAQVVLEDGGERLLLQDGKGKSPDFFKGMRLDFFENIFFIRTGELAFSEQRSFLDDLKKRVLDTGRLYRAKELIKLKLGSSLRPLGEGIRKEGELNRGISELERRVEELEGKKEQCLQIRKEMERMEAIEGELSRLREERERLSGRRELLLKVHRKRELRERYKALLKEMERVKEGESLKEQLKGFSGIEGEGLTKLQEMEREEEGLKEKVASLKREEEGLKEELSKKEKELRERKERIRERKAEEERLSWRLRQLEGVREEIWRSLLKEKEELDRLKKALQDAGKELKEFRERSEALSSEERDLLRRIGRLRPLKWAALLLMSLGLALALWKGEKVLLFSGIVLIVGGGVYLWLRDKMKKLEWLRESKKKEASDASGKMRETEGKREDLRRQVDEIERRRDERLREAGAGSLKQYEELLDQKRETERELAALRVEIAQMEQRAREEEQEIKTLEERIRNLKDETRKAMGRKEWLKGEVEKRLKGAGLTTVKEYEGRLIRKRELLSRLSSLEPLLQRKGEIEEEMAELEVQLKELEGIPEGLPDEGGIEDNYRKVQERYEELQSEFDTLRGRVEEMIAFLGGDEGEIFNLLWRSQKELEALKREREELLLVYELLMKLEKEVEGSLMEMLQGRALEWFRFITGGETEELRLLRSDILLSSPQRSLSVNELSSGTRDPLYFAMRLAMAEKVSQGDFFLLLDDPFLTCDQERTLRLVDLLFAVSSRFQILLATKDPWLRDLVLQRGAALIDLSP